MLRLFTALLLLATVAGCGVVVSDRLSDSQQVIADMRFGGPGDLQIAGALDQPDHKYRVGEPIGLTVQVSKPAHVAVLRVLPTGDTSLVFPNRLQTDAKVAPGTVLHLPAPGAPMAGAQPGPILFEFIASERPGSWLFTRKPASGDFASLGATTRELARDIVTSLKPGPANRVAGAQLTINVGGN